MHMNGVRATFGRQAGCFHHCSSLTASLLSWLAGSWIIMPGLMYALEGENLLRSSFELNLKPCEYLPMSHWTHSRRADLYITAMKARGLSWFHFFIPWSGTLIMGSPANGNVGLG